ncbi:MAG: hypothetical protein ACKESB_03095 [Candidatus Hodgkinia cicadicola]
MFSTNTPSVHAGQNWLNAHSMMHVISRPLLCFNPMILNRIQTMQKTFGLASVSAIDA